MRRCNGNLTIVPVLNKIDLPIARPDEVMRGDGDGAGHRPAEVLHGQRQDRHGRRRRASSAIVERVPPPPGDPTAPLQALVFDSNYDEYRGVVIYVRVMDGTSADGQKIRFMRTGTVARGARAGPVRPDMVRLRIAGTPARWVTSSPARSRRSASPHRRHGDRRRRTRPPQPLPGYKEPKRMVFCGLYPVDATDFEELREALQKLSLNDPSFTFEPETSDALGFGFRCGFLGLLHMEIIQQRLESEANSTWCRPRRTSPTRSSPRAAKRCIIDNPQKVPDAGQIEEFREPIVQGQLPAAVRRTSAPMMQLCTDRRGIYIRTEYLSPTRAILVYEMPLAEVIYDLHDKLKSVTHGYGTMDYELLGYRPADLVRLDILVDGKRVDALSIIVHRANAERRGRALVKKLRGEIDRHMFEVADAGGHRQPRSSPAKRSRRCGRT